MMKPEQARLNEIQNLYRQWLRLQESLQLAQETWQQSADIMQKLEKFYNEEYVALLCKIDEGLQLDQRTRGELSVLSEDTIWNALHDQQKMAWRWVRLALKVLDMEQ